MTELFAKGETSATLRAHLAQLVQDIKNLSDNEILHGDLEEWVNYFFAEYKIQPITLFMDNVSKVLSETKVQTLSPFSRNGSYDYYMIDGYKITFKIPFDGDSELLFLRPSTFFMSRFPVESVKKSTKSS